MSTFDNYATEEEIYAKWSSYCKVMEYLGNTPLEYVVWCEQTGLKAHA